MNEVHACTLPLVVDIAFALTLVLFFHDAPARLRCVECVSAHQPSVNAKVLAPGVSLFFEDMCCVYVVLRLVCQSYTFPLSVVCFVVVLCFVGVCEGVFFPCGCVAASHLPSVPRPSPPCVLLPRLFSSAYRSCFPGCPVLLL